MDVEALDVPDAWVCRPTVHADSRGDFLEWFRADLLRAATGRRFEVMQANHSRSRAGVLRGVHFADVDPGQAKLVYCPQGAVLDVVVDVRVGSPTFGRHAAVLLDETERRAVFISEGLGHAFYALQDNSSVCYLMTSVYDPTAEHAVSPVDPALALPLPTEHPLVVSDRDAQAPTLAEAEAAGTLPTYEACRARYAELSDG
ncbi:MAG TPA: dTDP-4-dehydrorhamnose 3,5-epimerase [Mycobacteriales bacterium]|nr:dTDP-4-dehydrorhamnose 3,5-epimerase [Mycobacteriales bacterium]